MPTERSMPPDIITMVIDDRDDARHGDLLQDVEDVHRTDEGRVLRPARRDQLKENDDHDETGKDRKHGQVFVALEQRLLDRQCRVRGLRLAHAC